MLDEQEEIRTAALWARARAEEARWSSEARFRAVFVGTALGMAISTVDGALIEVNQALCDMLGFTEEELLNRHADDFIHPEDSPELRQQYARDHRGSPRASCGWRSPTSTRTATRSGPTSPSR